MIKFFYKTKSGSCGLHGKTVKKFVLN